MSKKHTNSFKLLWDAIKESRQSMWISTEVLIVITVLLTVIFYLAESKAQPDEYDFVNSLLWIFTRYIQDPAEVITVAPITFTGKLVGSIIGVLAILLFAVPAGIIGGAFNNTIEEDLRKKHLADMGVRLNKAFRRKQDPASMFKVVPRHLSLGTLQAKKCMTQDDIVDAVEFNTTFRLRNLATAQTRGSHTVDQLVVEMFAKNTPYGCCIDRGSNITIVCPSAVNEAGIGNFTYYLALIGGFNYISKEVDADVDDPISYYIIPDDADDDNITAYLADLRRLAKGADHYTIFIISSDVKKATDLHFLTTANAKTGRSSTLLDTVAFDHLYSRVSARLDADYGVKTDLNELRPAGPKNVSVRIGGGTDTNALTLRVASELVVWDTRYIAIARDIAMDIVDTFAHGRTTTPADTLKLSGYGYQ